MNSLTQKRKPKKSSLKRKKQVYDNPSSFSIKLFVAIGILLIVLLMKKYDLSIGQFNVDSIYEVVYH
ncbi:MAG: hypothetical protein H7X94_12805, partial [Vallitaleaceae bacterium]|nr:hypothetical protein [Vallitaleaceae bacterium]